jgi:hypothetical protein
LAISAQQDSNGWWYVSGVAADNLQGDWYPLGRIADRVEVDDGVHYWGVDMSNPSRATLRLFFDTNRQRNDLGYIQFAELSAFGWPIPPRLVPGLASRRWYFTDKPTSLDDGGGSESGMIDANPGASDWGPRAIFLDFFEPVVAAALQDLTAEVPFYAFTGSATRALNSNFRIANGAMNVNLQNLTYETFGSHPLPNGSIRLAKPPFQRAALAPSLTLRLNPFFPTAQALTNAFLLEDAVWVDIPNTNTQTNEGLTDYDFALAAYRRTNWPVNEIVDVHAVGPYLLLTRNARSQSGDIAPLTGVFRIQRGNPASRVYAWFTGEETLADLEHEATIEAVENIGAWLRANNIGSGKEPDASSAPKGRVARGWSAPPHEIVTWSSDAWLKLELYSMLFDRERAVAYKPMKNTPGRIFPNTKLTQLSGLRTTFGWRFDRVTERMRLELTESRPERISGDEFLFDAALRKYKEAIDNPPQEQDADFSVFDLGGSPWFNSVPPRSANG